MSASLAVVSRSPESLQPDISWIKKNVPILEIAKALGLRIRHHRTRCWRPENHAHGDTDPSLHLCARRNRATCFVCDTRGGHSNVDLGRNILGIDVGPAVRWIAGRFVVPNVKRGRPVNSGIKQPVPYRVGVHGSELEVLVRSGMWGQLSAAERSILVALHEFRDQESGLTRMSYGAILRYAGIAGRTTVSNALTHLQRFHLIQVHQGARIGITRECSMYRVTLEDPKFLNLCNEIYNRSRKEIEQERAYRKELRNDRQRLSRPVTATSGGSIVHEESARRLNTRTLAGHLRFPAPSLRKENDRESTLPYPGLPLSPSTGLKSNKTVHGKDREIRLMENGSTMGDG